MGSIKGNIVAYRQTLQAYKDSVANSGYTWGTCNCGTTISNIFNFAAFAGVLGGALNTGANAVNNMIANSQAKKEEESGSSSSINSVFTYGNDYKIDYAEGAVKAIDKDIEKIEEDIATKNKSIKDLKIDDLRTKSSDADKAVENKAKALNDAKAAYDTANNVQGEKRDEAEVSRLKYAWETAQSEHTKALDAQTKAKNALTAAEENEKKYLDEIEKLEKTKEELETKRNEYKALDDANGNSASERIKSKKANNEDSIKNDTFEMQNARQLINEFASARRAYESNPTEENKKQLQTAQQNFLAEYDNSGNDTANAEVRNSKTMQAAYNLIKNYKIK